MRRLRVLMSSYACEPGKGSEPAVGWNAASAMADHHDVWVLTRSNNREAIEHAIASEMRPGLRFAYVDLPPWVLSLKRGMAGLQAYYYLWQHQAWRVARTLHRDIGFSLVHHVTFAKYWSPSHMWRLPIPFVWGPVGGGDATPAAFMKDLGLQGYAYEVTRVFARAIGERDPLVRATARRSTVALAATPATADKLRSLGASDVRLMPAIGLSRDDLHSSAPSSTRRREEFRFVSMGDLLALKGTHIGLRAFAKAKIPNATYWVLGEGPERAHLMRLASELGIASQVVFWGQLPRRDALAQLAASDVLIHPSLHDSGGVVCLEAMAAGKPVVCLDLAGPAMHVSALTGMKVRPRSPAATVDGIAGAMRSLFLDDALRLRMGAAGRAAASEKFAWSVKARALDSLYRALG